MAEKRRALIRADTHGALNISTGAPLIPSPAAVLEYYVFNGLHAPWAYANVGHGQAAE